MTNQSNDTPANDAEAANDGSVGGRVQGATAKVRDAASTAKTVAGDAYAVALDKVTDTVDAVKEKSGAAYSAAVDRTSDAYAAAKDKAGAAYDAARGSASQARQVTADSIDENPLAALIGGIALGVLVGALLPRSKREADALGPIAGRLGETARAAFAAATDAGKQKLDELGINRETARGQVDKLVDTAVQAATSATSAATDTVRR